ncbi:hypothetical protein LEP1GSC018_4046 [Leptospira kirschneri str. 2008720114]|nr:hypothetical protein LEP1GSC018_4046 [Leptospira kirschneri str. 2008720114]
MEIKEIECITITHNNLTRAKEPGPACRQIRPGFFTSNLS